MVVFVGTWFFVPVFGPMIFLFNIARHLPATHQPALLPLFLIATCFLTSANSAAVAPAMFLPGHGNPNRVRTG